MKSWQISEDSTSSSEVVKRKLKECRGRAVITSCSGNKYEIWAEPDGRSFGCDALPGNTLTYDIFDICSRVS